MKRRYYREWEKFASNSAEFLSENMHKGRITMKYRNKRPSNAKLYVTNDNKSHFIKLTQKSDLDKVETYLEGVHHMLANKPMEKKVTTTEEVKEAKKNKKNKKDKGKH